MCTIWLTLLILGVINSGGKLEAATSSVDAVVSLMQTPGRHSSIFLTEVARVLKPGGDCLVQEPLLVDGQELKVWNYTISLIFQRGCCSKNCILVWPPSLNDVRFTWWKLVFVLMKVQRHKELGRSL